MVREKLSQRTRDHFLKTLNFCFKIYQVDLIELKGNGEPYNDYRKIRPYGGKCNC